MTLKTKTFDPNSVAKQLFRASQAFQRTVFLDFASDSDLERLILQQLPNIRMELMGLRRSSLDPVIDEQYFLIPCASGLWLVPLGDLRFISVAITEDLVEPAPVCLSVTNIC